MRRLARPFLILVCALTGGLLAQPSCAATITLQIILFGSHIDKEAPRRPVEPLVSRYQPDHGPSFVFDRACNPPLVRFEDSPEIWILQPQPGPRGDTIYRNDMGQPVLRATKLGGLTVFTADDPAGAAAAFDGEAPSLRLPPLMSPDALIQHVIQATARLSYAAQRRIYISTVDDAKDEATPETAPLVAETAIVTAEAITRAAHGPNGRTVLTKVNKVLLARGARPDVQLSGGALTVTYEPNSGFGVWPSSERILQNLTK